MTTDTGMTAVGTIAEMIGAETIGAETTGVEINGVESKPAEKPNAIVIGSAIRIGTCDTATRTIAATIASATPRLHHSSCIHRTSVASTGEELTSGTKVPDDTLTVRPLPRHPVENRFR